MLHHKGIGQRCMAHCWSVANALRMSCTALDDSTAQHSTAKRDGLRSEPMWLSTAAVDDAWQQSDSSMLAQGERSAVRYLFRQGLEVNPRSRYVHLSWAIFERDFGNIENARELFRRGHGLNPQDAAILQVNHTFCNLSAAADKWHLPVARTAACACATMLVLTFCASCIAAGKACVSANLSV